MILHFSILFVIAVAGLLCGRTVRMQKLGALERGQQPSTSLGDAVWLSGLLSGNVFYNK